MAAKASANAASFGVEHHTLEIPWGVPPFPSRPSNGAFEAVCREARYRVIFDAMTRSGATTAAFGHHADDQVETALMRLSQGSTLAGAAGMRRCRRWGMGSGSSEDALDWVGHRGMNRYIVRPFLDFRKDRILATCEANGLDYIHDPTNFQPAITLRNAIRQMLNADDSADSNSFDPTTLPQSISESMANVQSATSYLGSMVTGVNGLKERLYCATKMLLERLENIDSEVTHRLERLVRPSPPGTLRLSASKLSAISDVDLRRALIWRVMRYVSFYPWGSLGAEGFRRQRGIDQIVSSLWAPNLQAVQVKKFTVGSGVLWAPVIPKSPRRRKGQKKYLRHPPELTWLVSRAPPFSKNPQAGMSSASRLTVDATEQLVTAIQSEGSSQPVEVLYDCRFLIRFDLGKIPGDIETAIKDREETVSVRIHPNSPHYLPKVVLQRASRPDQVLAVLTDKGTVETMMDSSPWISIEWARPLEAI